MFYKDWLLAIDLYGVKSVIIMLKIVSKLMMN